MPLARAALYAQHVDVYVAPTWDDSDSWVASMRHIAKEGRMYVIGVNTVQRVTDVPPDVPGHAEHYSGGPDDWMSRGNSVIVGPDGTVLAGPVRDQEEILLAELDIAAAQALAPAVRPGRPLQPTGRLPADRRHDPPPRSPPLITRNCRGGARVRSRPGQPDTLPGMSRDTGGLAP